MAFKKLSRSTRKPSLQGPRLTLSTSSNGSTYLALNSAAKQAMGDPVAVALFWDDEECLLRIAACSPEDPDSFAVGKHARLSVTSVVRDMGLSITETVRVAAKADTRTSLLADLSELPAAGNIRPIRGAA